MTKEFRRITFSKKTLRKAVDGCSAATGDSIPGGDIVSISSAREGADFRFELELFDYVGKKNRKFRLSEADALEALIQYCLANKVALPRNSRKSVRLIDGNLAMDIFMGVDKDSNFEE
ncbi:MAG: hypothetical protein A3G18_07115 [Rhodospirillales bacterium RIFCSPLOWO2_12_FULL_58_28]|nr:MAG: hypothetical protein A3H92_11775 [Rhodospirillales bacterium RIFCSPLOWO2_02_FULL_58_16]OHC78642.1 MAG: hypothetical protein A3G18_07115 [Rhodospirillales bacterium RIFCSPLOWO2_12_FULL_58_28]